MNIILALLLITNTNIDVSNFKWMTNDIKSLALQMEILDQREVRYVLSKPDEFVSDMNMIRRRWEDLKNTPMLSLSAILPDRSMVNELLLFNRAYKQHIENCLVLYPNDRALRETKEEIELCYQFWDAIRDARCEYYYTHIRRQALGRILKFITIDDLAKGDLPPHVPLWRFTAIR